MYYGSGTAERTSGQPAESARAASASRPPVDVMSAILNVWRHIRNPTPSIDARIYLKNNAAKFHPDAVWNNGVLGLFLKSVAQNKKEKQRKQDEYRSDMGSIPGPKFCATFLPRDAQ